MPKGVYARTPKRYCKVGHDMDIVGRTSDTHCGECRRIRDRKRGHKAKVEVMRFYGSSRCACCGESELAFLTLDHINGDGADARRETKLSGRLFYRWLVQNGLPALPLQVLCWNCNAAKYYNNGCPHREVA